MLPEMRESTQLTLPITSEQQQSKNSDGSVSICLSNMIFKETSLQVLHQSMSNSKPLASVRGPLPHCVEAHAYTILAPSFDCLT